MSFWWTDEYFSLGLVLFWATDPSVDTTQKQGLLRIPLLITAPLFLGCLSVLAWVFYLWGVMRITFLRLAFVLLSWTDLICFQRIFRSFQLHVFFLRSGPGRHHFGTWYSHFEALTLSRKLVLQFCSKLVDITFLEIGTFKILFCHVLLALVHGKVIARLSLVFVEMRWSQSILIVMKFVLVLEMVYYLGMEV